MVTKDVLIAKAGSILNKRFRYQVLATFTMHILTFSHGIGLGWLSPSLQALNSNQTPLNFRVSISEASWIGSTFGLGSFTGNIIFGFLLDRIGRKWCMYLVALPHMMLWILIYFAQNVEMLYVARFLGGLTGGGNYLVVPIFVSEIADSSVRGALSSMTMIFVSIGVLMGFVISSHLPYHMIPCIVILLPVLYLVAAFMFPETPQYLLKNGKLTEAEASFKFYKNLKCDWEATSDTQKNCLEFNDLKQSMLKGTCPDEKLTLKDIFNKRAISALTSCVVVVLLNQLSGTFAFVNYMSLLFAASRTTMDTNTCTIIMGVVQIVGTLVAIFTVDRFGRKILLMISSFGMALGLIAFGLFAQFISDPTLYSWVPLAIMIFVMLIASVGIIALVFTIIVETLPSKIRSLGASFCMSFLSVMIFVSLKVFPTLLYDLGISNTMYCCAGATVLFSTYLAIFLKETNGKSMDFD